PLNRTFKIEIRLPRIQGAKPNMLATLRIADYENDKAIAIPINAVQTTEEGSIVMLLDSTMNKLVAKKVDVTVGKSSGTQMEITKGLSPGDQLIIVGNADLNDGQVVTLNNSEAVKPKKDE
ncbi:MAG: efflux RND transporter periplasmic adaptor subunit, partial [Bacteroidia bacterium]|nr:efflux RND transporter periplasmic adaptor subunit [Bacteroidia bacterium]